MNDQLAIDPVLQLELAIDEAAELLAWLVGLPDVQLPPVAQELRRVLAEGLADA